MQKIELFALILVMRAREIKDQLPGQSTVRVNGREAGPIQPPTFAIATPELGTGDLDRLAWVALQPQPKHLSLAKNTGG
jgi:hypothetical protein